MKVKDCLASLELLRNFVSKYVPSEVYMKNLVIDHVETPGKRLWALRESMRMDEEKFAALLDMTRDEYRQYEYIDKPVPSELLVRVASRLAVSIEWLSCECPMLPIPRPHRRKSS